MNRIKKYVVKAEEANRLDLICRSIYGKYNNRNARLIIDNNPQINWLSLGAGTVIKAKI